MHKGLLLFNSTTVRFDMQAVLREGDVLDAEAIDHKVETVAQFCHEAGILPVGLCVIEHRYLCVTFEMQLDSRVLYQAFERLLEAEAAVARGSNGHTAERQS